MPNAIKHQLFRLIKSLTKAEKRNFKLFATRSGSNAESLFIQLFDAVDRLEEPDDAIITNRLKLKPGQYSNLKRHLYQQVMTSLRIIYINKEIDIELREQIDFTRILYGKGHYLDALRTLERAKAKAVEHSQDLLHLEILEFQKLIESRHITLSRQVNNKMDRLLNESAHRCYSVLDTSELFSLNIQIHGHYIERGHARTESDKTETHKFWQHIQTVRVDRETSPTTFNQKVNRFQASMWFHYIQLDFNEALRAATNAHTMFTLSRQMILKDTGLYLRCIYYLTMFAYLNKDGKTLSRNVKRLEEFMADDDIHLNDNARQTGLIYLNLARFNQYFLNGDGAAAYRLGNDLSRDYKKKKFRPSQQRLGLFRYKHAAACFLGGYYDEALDYLNDIINMRLTIFRDDLLINTRLLHALCNFELTNYILVDYQLTSLNRLIRRSRETAEAHRLAVSGLRRLLKLPAGEHAPVYAKLRKELDALRDDPFEQKALAYLELEDWLRLHV